jgi:hypothetical protein
MPIKLTFGDQVVTIVGESGEYETESKNFHIHPGYNSKKAHNDIALIKLDVPVQENL